MSNNHRDYTVAIVEDDPELREEMAFLLTQHGFLVQAFENAGGFYRFLAVNRIAIAILDIGLPNEDGLAICRHLRAHDKQMGIVFMTARSQRADKLQGLEIGGDAYLVKPVDIDELVLTLKRLGERFLFMRKEPLSKLPDQKNLEWKIDLPSAAVVSPQGVRVSLTMNELQIMRVLSERSPDVCVASELGLAMGLLPDEFDKHRLEVIISRLRLKISRQVGVSIPIRSHRGIGYSLSGSKRESELPLV